MNIEEISQRIEKVMKTDATFAREADFMITHVPFKKLYDFVPESGQTNFEGGQAHYYINPEDYEDKLPFSEEELLIRFLDNPDTHKFLLIQGNSGTGKSNLIRWIYYKYKKMLNEEGDEKEQIIFIQRSYNSLKEAVKRILDYNILPDDRTRYYLDKIGGGGQEATGEELADIVYAMLEITIKHDKEYDEYIEEDEHDGLRTLMSDDSVKKNIFMKKDGPIDRYCQRISGNRTGNDAGDEPQKELDDNIFIEQDFTFTFSQLQEYLHFEGHKPTQDVMDSANYLFNDPSVKRNMVRYLNSLNEKVIALSSTLDASDVKGIFKEIRKELKIEEKRLTLFIEDINAYTGMDKALIEILIDDEEDDDSKKEMCRLKSMVGSTDNFYDLLHTSLKARITDSVVVLDESALSDESKRLEFAARYINAINLSADEVDSWYYGNSEMPVAEIKNKVTSVAIDGKTYSIYPFTKEAIENLYNCLEAHYRTPRGLLKYVIKHTLINWNTMEDRIFDTSTSFINVGIRSFKALKLPTEVQHMLTEMSNKERQYIQIWGFNYNTGSIVNNSENEKVLFKINVAADYVSTKKPHDDNNDKPRKKADAELSKRDKALNHVEEWEKGFNENFVIHKDMRDWIGKYIIGQINWQHEGILFSKAAEVCKGLSFIGIEGHDGQGTAELFIERNTENADFFRSIIYWNYDGERKNWKFPGGMEAKITAKVWLEKHRSEIISAVSRFGKLEQVSPEYVVRSKIYILLSRCQINTLDNSNLLSILVRGNNNCIELSSKNAKWNDWANATMRYDENINSLFKEYFFRTVGSSDVTNCGYIFVDMIFLEDVLGSVMRELVTGEDTKISRFGDKKLEAPISVINIYNQFKPEIISVSDSIIRSTLPSIEGAFGKNITKSIVVSSRNEMGRYLSYVNFGLNQTFSPDIINCINGEDTDTNLPVTINIVSKYLREKNPGAQLILLSQIDDILLQTVSQELKAFVKLMEEVEKKFASNLNANVEKDITLKRQDIEKLVNKLIDAGGEK